MSIKDIPSNLKHKPLIGVDYDSYMQTFLFSIKKIINVHQEDVVILLAACRFIAKEYAEVKSKLEREKFNVFTLISDLYYRENFHSDIMAFFLDPTAVHGHKYFKFFLLN